MNRHDGYVTSEAATAAVMATLAQVIPHHELQLELWEQLLVDSKLELEYLTRGAILQNNLGGLSSQEYQLAAINISVRIELLDLLLTTITHQRNQYAEA